MKRSSIALGAAVLGVVVVLLVRSGPRPAPQERVVVSAPPPSFAPLPLASPSVDLPPLEPMLALSVDRPSPPRPLPATAPKSVRFGVVLVQFRGAQFAPDVARSRREAQELASKLAEIAQKDFKAAVKKGDPGSTEDAGRISRGILEPAIEYELFTLKPGAVSEPIETPRGYWVARRIE